MSTDGVAPDRRFRRAFVTTAGLLLAVCVVFAGLGQFQGPRLRTVEFDPAIAARHPHATLVLRANQPLTAVTPGQISVAPAAEFTVATSGDAIAVRFTRRLAAGTDYRVTVAGVRGAHGSGRESTFRHRFTTPPPTVAFLQRGRVERGKGRGVDRIVTLALPGGKATEWFAAPRIQDFATSDERLFVVTGAPDTNALTSVDTAGKGSRQLPLPGAGRIEIIAASPGNRWLGYSFTPARGGTGGTSVLYVADLAGDAKPRAVRGLNGAPASVLQWAFAPDGTSLLARTVDGNLLLADATGRHRPELLGRFARVGNFSFDGGAISVDAGTGPVLLDTRKRTQTPVELTKGAALQPGDDADAHPMQVRLLNNSPGHLAQLRNLSGELGSSRQFFVFRRGDDARVLHRVAAGTNVAGFTLSPDDRYVALELGPAGGDRGAGDDATAAPVRTRVLRTDTGETVTEFDGAGVAWR